MVFLPEENLPHEQSEWANPPSKKKDNLLTSCIQKIFGARKFKFNLTTCVS
jgi:hypothetical protein